MAEVPELVCEGAAAVLGDIHGCASALEKLLPQLEGRELFVLGDVGDPYALWNASGPEQSLAVDRPVIMGHHPLREPLLRAHVLAIDTGAGTKQGGRLTALLLPERRTSSVAAPGLEAWTTKGQ